MRFALLYLDVNNLKPLMNKLIFNGNSIVTNNTNVVNSVYCVHAC